MKHILTIITFLLISTFASAQLYQSVVHVGWNTTIPLSDKDYIGKTSSAGVRVGFSKFINEKLGFGIEGSFSTLKDYIPLKTYEYPGGAITTDFYNYLYYFTVMGNAQYYFMQGEKFVPYVSLGMGIAFSEYRVFYNVYEDTDNSKGFVMRPEVGTLYKFKEYSSWGLKSSLSYEYAANKSDYFDTKNFSGINFLIGFVFFTD